VVVGGGRPRRRGRSQLMTPCASARFSKPIVLRDSAPLTSLDEARAFLATLSPAQVTPALSYARVVLGHALRTGKQLDIERARRELTKAFRAAGWTYRPRGRPRSMRHAQDGSDPE
jgi:hypothetical protein